MKYHSKKFYSILELAVRAQALSIAIFIFLPIFSNPKHNHPDIPLKILVLIIASDNQPVYLKLQELWRSYMHKDPQHITAYFIKGDPNLPYLYDIDHDIIWSQVKESIKPGVINKTLVSFEAMLPKIREYDYIVRTNLSSFYVFDRLLTYLKDCPREKFYAAHIQGYNAVRLPAETFYIGSGCGFIVTPDLIELMVAHKQFFMNNKSFWDDQLIGIFLHNKGIKLVNHDRLDIYSMNQWHHKKNSLPETTFQVRVKNPDSRRTTDDIAIHKELIKKFYQITL